MTTGFGKGSSWCTSSATGESTSPTGSLGGRTGYMWVGCGCGTGEVGSGSDGVITVSSAGALGESGRCSEDGTGGGEGAEGIFLI